MRNSTVPENVQIPVTANPIDQDYLRATSMELVAGEDLTDQDIADVSKEKWEDRVHHFILNEGAAKELGWTPEEAIGKRMYLDNSRPGFVRGVVKDFHFESMHKAIRPLVLFANAENRTILVKISGANVPETIASLGERWKGMFTDFPFEYRFNGR